MENKYICDICKFSCIFQSSWEQHILTLKHKNNGKCVGKKKNIIRKCNHCEYIATHDEGLKIHYLSKHANVLRKRKRI